MVSQLGKPDGRSINKTVNYPEAVPGDWDLRPLSSFAKEINDRYTKAKNGPVLSVTKYKGFVKSLDYFNRRMYSKDISNYKLVQKGEFAYATIHLDEGSIGLSKEFAYGYISPMYTVFRTDSSIDPDYLYYLLRSHAFLQKYSAIGQGSINRRKAISFDTLSQLRVPFPPLREQHKIVSIISRIDAFIDCVDQILDRTKRLKQGLMRKFLVKGIGKNKLTEVSFNGKKLTIPQGWNLAYLKDLAEINPRIVPNLKGHYVQFIPMACVEEESGLVDLSITKQYDEVSKGYTAFIEGDIIFAKITPCMENGKIAVLKGLKNGMGFGSTEFHVIRSKNTGFRDFIFYYLMDSNFREKAQRQMCGSAGQQRVPREFLDKTIVPVPPIEEQQRITSVLSNISNAIRLEQCERILLDRLKKGLIQKLMTGEVRVKP